jgi:hypothetical protein
VSINKDLYYFWANYFFGMFLNLNNMILAHAKDFFGEENGPNLSDFENK